ncbi:hypothetical protein OKW43_000739 [Paraburkholderia sp. WC7.3g]
MQSAIDAMLSACGGGALSIIPEVIDAWMQTRNDPHPRTTRGGGATGEHTGMAGPDNSSFARPAQCDSIEPSLRGYVTMPQASGSSPICLIG